MGELGPALPWSCCSPGEAGLAPGAVERLRTALNRRSSEGLEGGSLCAILCGGRLAFLHAAGGTGVDPPALDALCRIYSMTKPLVAAAFLVLVDEGRVALDDLLAQYLPNFAAPRVLVRPSRAARAKAAAMTVEAGFTLSARLLEAQALEYRPARRPITLRMLLTHTSGLGYGPGVEYKSPRHEIDRLYAELCRDTEAARIVDLAGWVERLAEVPLLHHPGECFHYGYSTDVLGRVVEVISGCRLEECLRDRILTPLAMSSTCFAVPLGSAQRLLPLHRLHGRRGKGRAQHAFGEPRLEVVDCAGETSQWASGRESRVHSAGGGVESIRGGAVSSVGDYLRFCAMLLAGGLAQNGERVLSASVVRAAFTDQLSLVTQGRVREQKPGVGWGLLGAVNLSKSPVGQLSWGGFACTRFGISPKRDLAYVFFSQTLHGVSPTVDIERAFGDACEAGPQFTHGRPLRASSLALGVASAPSEVEAGSLAAGRGRRRRWVKRHNEGVTDQGVDAFRGYPKSHLDIA